MTKANYINTAQGPSVRERAMDAAAICFQNLGLGKTGMETVAQQGGMSRATLYRHFSNRDELALAVIEREALQVAARDAVLQMKGQLAQQFSEEIGRLVRGEMEHAVLLERLILEVAGRVRAEAGLDDAAQVEILLPEGARDLADLRDDPEELRHGELSRFVVEVAGNMLRQGVTLTPSKQIREGIRIRLTDKQIEIDLSSEAIAKHLLEHLLPRFRALLEGMVY